MSADKPDGVWCAACRKRHGYKSMGIDFERASNGKWRINWSCPSTGNVIQQQEL